MSRKSCLLYRIKKCKGEAQQKDFWKGQWISSLRRNVGEEELSDLPTCALMVMISPELQETNPELSALHRSSFPTPSWDPMSWTYLQTLIWNWPKVQKAWVEKKGDSWREEAPSLLSWQSSRFCFCLSLEGGSNLHQALPLQTYGCEQRAHLSTRRNGWMNRLKGLYAQSVVVRSSNSQLVSFDRCQGLKPGLVSSTCVSSIAIASVQYILLHKFFAPLLSVEPRHPYFVLLS